MPTYDYECSKCQMVKEVYHSIKLDPQVECDACGSLMFRVPCVCDIIIGSLAKESEKQEKSKKISDINHDLRENYGVHGLSPVKNREGKGFEDAYKDIKDRGTKIKDQMQAEVCKSEERMRKKQKKRQEDNREKIRKIVEQRKEDHAKRKG